MSWEECNFTNSPSMSLFVKLKIFENVGYCLIYPINVHFPMLAFGGTSNRCGEEPDVENWKRQWWLIFYRCLQKFQKNLELLLVLPQHDPLISLLGKGNGICCDGRCGLLWTECSGAILTPNLMVLGGRAFGRRLCQEGGAHMNGINALICETPEHSPAPSPVWEHS